MMVPSVSSIDDSRLSDNIAGCIQVGAGRLDHSALAIGGTAHYMK